MSKMITLYPLKQFRFPVTAECISPDIFQDKKCEEVEALKIWEGNKKKRLGELFKVEETKTDQHQAETTLAISGDLSEVRRIGAYMTGGSITIKGDVGTHLGEEMKGGKITVHGNVASWAGSMMKGGTIEIRGNTSDYLGAPYRGSNQGMRGGEIIVHGDVGNETGAYMKKGLIKIYGNVGQFAGSRMHNGTIYVQKNCEGRVGACMRNGKIIIGGFLESVLPTFTIDSIRKRVKIGGDDAVEGYFYRFLGDLAENGIGKLFVFKDKNPQLHHYEEFL